MNELDDFLFQATEADPIDLTYITEDLTNEDQIQNSHNLFLKDLLTGIKDEELILRLDSIDNEEVKNDAKLKLQGLKTQLHKYKTKYEIHREQKQDVVHRDES